MTLVEHVQTQSVRSQLLPWGKHQAVQCYRAAGLPQHETPLVLLHGIGSNACGWIYQLDAANAAQCTQVLAWDAPGYGHSSAVLPDQPSAEDYALRLWAWLDALGCQRVRLVGHSLGCLMAASAARLQSQRVQALTLLAPAQGYARARAEVRDQRTQERLSAMAQLGAAQLAQARAPALLASQADPEQVALAVHMMSQLHPAGYAQATHLLAHGDIMADLQAVMGSSPLPVTIACGELDTITPAKSCRALAHAVGAPYVSLGDVGHLCPMEAHKQVNTLLGISPSAT
jgi:pimeloyl-ACP methyl ester carboxylesterase